MAQPVFGKAQPRGVRRLRFVLAVVLGSALAGHRLEHGLPAGWLFAGGASYLLWGGRSQPRSLAGLARPGQAPSSATSMEST
eukprot:CAMPEP_0115050386 /NCGR_PEP_ID=MMETSP0227-20121206/1748_1 /TAXON_ID=89957 /ORGANISM="Polarella glacialis, Strain CCMP 1383" /LENGTH=81 /DNA_ID=CAMNT_0002434221 /DNA_START=61 /DNA_END=302 /DNA_ORIENTATION=+